MKRQAFNDKVIVVGIDGMEPKTAKRLMEEGRMPNLKKIHDAGAHRADMRMLGIMPTITPPGWTTLGTGAYPGTHGITCYWRQSPDSLDAVVYNMDSRNCTAEQMWNVTAEAGIKTLVWHWPGSSWPPSSDSPNLSVVDGTQPGSVNMGVGQMDWEKVCVASASINEVTYAPRVEKPLGAGCIMTDIDDMVVGDNEDEMMELWWGDEARKGGEIRTYVCNLDDTEIMIGAKVAYDIVNSSLKDAQKWGFDVPEGAKEFTILTSSGITRRPCLLLKNAEGKYDTVQVYKNKKTAEPIVTVKMDGQMVGGVDDVTKKGETKPCYRAYKRLECAEDGTMVRMWISNALDTTNDMLWHTKDLYPEIIDNVGYVPPVSLIGGEDEELVEQIFIPSWDVYNKWQADAMNYLIEHNDYKVVFSHLHNVDNAGHQFWHLAHTLKPWDYTDEKFYQSMIERVYEATDKYFGEFVHLLDEGWNLFVVSDHGLVVGENVPPILGEYGGLNTAVMEELGYTVMKKDENGNSTREVDWEKTRAVQVRSNYIYVNLKGRDKTGIVDPKDKYDLETEIINDLYNYRDKETGKRIVGIALRNKDAVIIGVTGPECGDIFFSIEEGFNRLHGDSITTSDGYFNTTVSPIFCAAGPGIKKNFDTDRQIRQVDVVPTIAALLGTRFPHQCEGAPLYQIFEEEF